MDDSNPAPASADSVLPVRLTPAERSVVQLVLDGCANREIASVRGSSEATVKHQLFRIYRKFGIHSRARLMVLAAHPRLAALHCPDN